MVSRVECFDHHFHLVLILYEEISTGEDVVHRVNQPVKAASSSTLLRESNNA